MIVVIGSPVAASGDGAPVAGGDAARTAALIAATGRTVELVGRVGSDPAGDAVVLSLDRSGIGHAALIRDSARPTPSGDASAGLPLDAGDVQLALQYLTTFELIVLFGASGDSAHARALAASAASGAAFAGARLILVDPAHSGSSPEAVAARAIA